jgi:tripartite-type tricarboxylate transporter receptor subunit TctC
MQSNTRSRRLFLRAAAASIAGTVAPRATWAQAASLRLLCMGPAGSIPDTIARRYAEQLGARYAGGVVVDNRPGAAGQIAIGALKQAAPDGATMLLAAGAIATVHPFLYAKLGYDPATDLKPVAVAAEATLALAVGPAVPDSVRSLAGFIDWARGNAALANYGSPGAGTLPHMLSALLFREAKVDAQHVAYPGGPAAILDLLGGRLACLALPEGLLRPHHAAGKLRVLATSAAVRSTFMPEVPTFVEQGHPRLAIREWFGFFLPGASSAAVMDNASQTLRAATDNKALGAAFGDMGMLVSAGTAGAATAMNERIATEQRYWREVIAATGIRLEA